MKILFLNSLPKSLSASETNRSIYLQYIRKDVIEAYRQDATQCISYIGHKATVDAINKDLGISLEVSREKACPESGDMIVVCSFDLPEDLERGFRLPEEELVKLPLSYMFVGRVNPSFTHTYW